MKQLDILRHANAARNVEWAKAEGTGEPVKLSAAFRGLELGGEAGELLNVIKKLERERLGLPGSRTNRAKLMQEMGDVLITLDLIGMDLGVSLWEAAMYSFNTKSDEMGFNTKLADVPRSLSTEQVDSQFDNIFGEKGE